MGSSQVVEIVSPALKLQSAASVENEIVSAIELMQRAPTTCEHRELPPECDRAFSATATRHPCRLLQISRYILFNFYLTKIKWIALIVINENTKYKLDIS